MTTNSYNKQPVNYLSFKVENRSTHKIYLLYNLLGSGGFGNTYRGLAPNNQYYAVKKVLKREGELEDAYEERCIEEIRFYEPLDHPNICKLDHSFIGTDSIYYLVFELCRNETLADYIKARKGVTDKEARYIMHSLFSAVLHLQEHRMIHRDLKPENILLGLDMELKICDFNLSAQIGPNEDSIKGYCGTVPYMAPEVIRDEGEGYSYKIDSWALGVIFCELILGFNPFKNCSSNKLIEKFNEPELEIHESLDTLNLECKNCIKYILKVEQEDRPTISQIMDQSYFKRSIPKRLFESFLYNRPSFRLKDLIHLHGNEDYQISVDSATISEDTEEPDSKKIKLNSPTTPTTSTNPPLNAFSISRLSSSDVNEVCSFCSTQGCNMCALQD